MNKNLQISIINHMGSTDLSLYEKQMCECVLYNYINQILKANQSVKNSISSLVQSYAGGIIDKVLNLKSKYLSYNLMLQEIQRINKSSFYDFDDDDLNTIYQLYLNKTLLSKFDTDNFQQSMYKITDLTHKEYKKLNIIHYNIMVPICLYYIENYNIKASDLEIFSVKQTDGDIIGNEIIFAIQNISPSRILSDIKHHKINIEYQNILVQGNMVRLILK